jgi:hypothetical protein
MTFVNVNYFKIVLILSEFILISFIEMICLKKLTFFLKNLHFSDFRSRLNSLIFFSTFCIFFIWFFHVFLMYMKMLSRYAITKSSKYSYSTWLINAWKIADVLINLNDMIKYSYSLNHVQNAVFHFFFSFI